MSRRISQLQRAILEVLPDREHDPLSDPRIFAAHRGGYTLRWISHQFDRPKWFCAEVFETSGEDILVGRRDDFAVYRALQSLERRGLVYRVGGSSRRWLRTSRSVRSSPSPGQQVAA